MKIIIESSTSGTRPDDSEDTESKIYQPLAMQRLQNGEQTENRNISTEYISLFGTESIAI